MGTVVDFSTRSYLMIRTESGHGATSLAISMDGTSPMSPPAASRAAL